jgi:hypothetical protein
MINSYDPRMGFFTGKTYAIETTERARLAVV